MYTVKFSNGKIVKAWDGQKMPDSIDSPFNVEIMEDMFLKIKFKAL